MKRFHIHLLSLALLAMIFSSCTRTVINPTQDGNWVYMGDFGGTARTNATSFVIGNYAYVGTGVDRQNIRYNDLWKFDPTGTTTWNQVASSPMAPRSSAVGFAVNGKGYIGTGYDGYFGMSDFWEYDPASNSWKKVASLGDQNNGLKVRYDAVAFGLDAAGSGYVGTGNDGVNYYNDFWKFTPPTTTAATDTGAWSQISILPGFKRSQAVAFTYQNKGYVVTGIGTGGSTVYDFFSFDPSKPYNQQWYQLRPIENFSPFSYDDGWINIMRYGAVGFVMTGTTSDGGGDVAYLTTGSAGSITWAYNFADSLWNQKTSYERASRYGAVGFSVQNKGFVGLGSSGPNSSGTTYANMDQWFPDQPYNQQD
jgi:N-acetylneuraminic acid mutarotase